MTRKIVIQINTTADINALAEVSAKQDRQNARVKQKVRKANNMTSPLATSYRFRLCVGLM